MRILADTKDMPIEEWRKLRKKSIGGSDAATILGYNDYKSPYTLYADKKDLIPDKEDNEAMRQGRDLEEYVAQRFCEANGKKVRRDNHMYMHDEYDFITANIDRRIVGENAGLECKTTSVFNKSDFEGGEIPLYYYCQCIHYMAVMGFEKMYLAIVILSKGFYWFEISRNENEINSLLKAEVDFWKNYIEKDIPPEIDGSDSTSDTIKYIFREHQGKDDVYIKEDIDILQSIKAKKKDIETQEKEYQNRIIAALGDNEKGYSDKYIVTYKTQKSTAIDGKKLKADNPELYGQYSKEKISNVMRIKERK